MSAVSLAITRMRTATHGVSGLASFWCACDYATHLEIQLVLCQEFGALCMQGYAHLEEDIARRTRCNGASGFQVCKNIHTWKCNSFYVKNLVLQVCKVIHTWKRISPAEHVATEPQAPRCARTSTPGNATRSMPVI